MALVLVGLAFGLRLHWLGAWELSFDEVASLFIARKSPLELLAYLRRAIREHPPLYYLILAVWVRLAGNAEFIVRFPSVLVGVTTVALLYRVASRWMGRWVGLIAGLLLTLSPSHIWTSQIARMYGLMILLNLLSVHFFWRLLQGGTRFVWWAFAATTIAGLCTHYYSAFVLLALNLFLLSGGRRYRHLWARWATFHGVALILVAVWLTGGGPGETVKSILQRGLPDVVRWKDLTQVINTVIFGPYRKLEWQALVVMGLLILGGWVLAGWRNLWRGLQWRGALLLALWLLVPLICLVAVPVPMEGRYVIGVVLPALLAIAVAVSRLRLRAWPIALLALTVVLLPCVQALPELYGDRFGVYRSRVERVRELALEGDPLILNGPWQRLLLKYYDPGDVTPISLPASAPPGIDPERADSTLQGIFEDHRRAWVSYDSLNATDPERFVAKWLHAHTHQVLQERGLALYYRAPQIDLEEAISSMPMETEPTASRDLPLRLYLPLVLGGADQYEMVRDVDVRFGQALRLTKLGIASQEVRSGDAVLAALQWESLRDLEGKIRMRLDFVDEDGWIWSSYAFNAAPYDCPATPWSAGEVRLERRGVVVPVGTPPGTYTLRLTLFDAEDVPMSPEGAEATFFPVTQVEVVPSLSAQRVGWVRSNQPLEVFDGKLELLRCDPWGESFSPGHRMTFTCYWRAREDLTSPYRLRLQFVQRNGAVVQEREVPLSTDYPPSEWVPGLIVAEHHAPEVSPALSQGRYQLRVRLQDEGGRTLEEEITLFPFEVEWPRATYRLPHMAHRMDATLGEEIHLRGYDLDRAGDSLQLTLYWQADARPGEDYFVLVHVGAQDEAPVAQADGVPASWMRATSTWRPGEVIVDEHEISLEGAPTGQYGVYVGLYDPDTGQRLPAVVDGSGTLDARVLLETIEVSE